jgi:hypothetical protein
MNTQETFTKYALVCTQNASLLAVANNQRLINGDKLFWGTYGYIRQLEHFTILANIIGILPHIDKLDMYFDQHFAEVTASISFGSRKRLPFNKKLYVELNTLVRNSNISKVDFVLLFFLSFSDLSSETIHYCE